MRNILCITLLLIGTIHALAQCSSDWNIKVKRSSSEPPRTPATQAAVYVIREGIGYGTVRALVDDEPVGAAGKNGYFVFSLRPGEHRICSDAKWATRIIQHGRMNLSVEAGKVYFLLANYESQFGGKDHIMISRLEDAQASARLSKMVRYELTRPRK